MAQWIARIAAMLVIAIPVSTASADWQVDRAQAIAAKVWNDPCAGHVTIAYGVPAKPSWIGWSDPWSCTVTLSSTVTFTWMPLCSLIVHEYGHLAGFRDPTNVADPIHSADPESIMYFYVHTNPDCKDYGAAMLGTWPREVPVKAIGVPAFARMTGPAPTACNPRTARRHKRRHAQRKRVPTRCGAHAPRVRP